jgi:hypothetical protein
VLGDFSNLNSPKRDSVNLCRPASATSCSHIRLVRPVYVCALRGDKLSLNKPGSRHPTLHHTALIRYAGNSYTSFYLFSRAHCARGVGDGPRTRIDIPLWLWRLAHGGFFLGADHVCLLGGESSSGRFEWMDPLGTRSASESSVDV